MRFRPGNKVDSLNDGDVFFKDVRESSRTAACGPALAPAAISATTAVLLLCLAVYTGADCVLCEALHALLDTAEHASCCTALLRRVWEHAVVSEAAYPFGAARVPALLCFTTSVCALGTALLLVLEALPSVYALFLLGSTSVAETESAVETAATLVATAAISAGAAAANRLAGRWSRYSHRASCGAQARASPLPLLCLRAALLLLCARSQHGRRHGSSDGDGGGGHTTAVFALFASADAAARLEAAVSIALLTNLAIRACKRAASSGRLLMQCAPGNLSTLRAIVSAARRVEHVRAVEDACFWALDETHAVGSLTCVVSADGDAESVLQRVHALFAAHTHRLVVTLADDDGDICEACEACDDPEQLPI